MSQLSGLQFGSGLVFATPLIGSGNPAPNPTPLQVGVVQNVKFTLGADIKTLFGQNQWPVDSAIGKRTITGSFEFAQMSNVLFANLFTGDAIAAGVIETANNEAHSIPATPYQVTITPPGSGTYVADYGATFTLTGKPLTRVASGPTTGQYSVNQATGVYTFAAADTLLNVLISYTYTNTTLGTTLVASNQTMGYGPIVSLDLVFPYEGGGIGFLFPNVRLGKLDFTTKLDDYTMCSTDFQAFAGTGSPFTSYAAY